jgi:hypothetical protein
MARHVKLFREILDSSIWGEDDATRLLWVTMIAMASDGGEVLASLPGLASRARIDMGSCEKSISRLASPDAQSRTQANGGRRIEAIDGGWIVLNYQKYQSIVSMADVRAYNRDRQTARRTKAERTKESPHPAAVITPRTKKAQDDPREVFESWNSTEGVTKVRSITSARIAKMKARLRDPFFRSNWRDAIAKIPSCPFLIGENDRNWTATIEWFMRPDSVIKVMEGTYSSSSLDRRKFSGMDEQLDMPEL